MDLIKYTILLLAIFIFEYSNGQGIGAPPAAGPPEPSEPEDNRKYDLEIQKVLPLNKTDYVVFNGLKVKRHNKTCELFLVIYQNRLIEVNFLLNHRLCC